MSQITDEERCTRRVYQIYHPDEPEIRYIGSTHKTLAVRMREHRLDFEAWKEGKPRHHFTSFNIFEKHDPIECNITSLEQQDECTKKEIEIREQHWLNTLPHVNKNAAYLTEEERKIKEANYKKEWAERNKEHVKELRKANYAKDREEILAERKTPEARQERNAYNKDRYTNDESYREKEKAKASAAYAKNKDKIIAAGKQKVTCECGLEMAKSSLCKHRKTKTHKDRISSQKSKNSDIIFTEDDEATNILS